MTKLESIKKIMRDECWYKDTERKRKAYIDICYMIMEEDIAEVKKVEKAVPKKVKKSKDSAKKVKTTKKKG